MRKSEMTSEQLSLRDSLLHFLTENDWDSEDSNWFEEDLWSQYELSPLFDNGALLIELELNMEQEYLNMILTDNASGGEVFIVIKTLETISDVLDKINSFKEDISVDNFQFHINSLFEVTHSIYADDGTNNLVELSPEDSE